MSKDTPETFGFGIIPDEGQLKAALPTECPCCSSIKKQSVKDDDGYLCEIICENCREKLWSYS